MSISHDCLSPELYNLSRDDRIISEMETLLPDHQAPQINYEKLLKPNNFLLRKQAVVVFVYEVGIAVAVMHGVSRPPMYDE